LPELLNHLRQGVTLNMRFVSFVACFLPFRATAVFSQRSLWWLSGWIEYRVNVNPSDCIALLVTPLTDAHWILTTKPTIHRSPPVKSLNILDQVQVRRQSVDCGSALSLRATAVFHSGASGGCQGGSSTESMTIRLIALHCLSHS